MVARVTEWEVGQYQGHHRHDAQPPTTALEQPVTASSTYTAISPLITLCPRVITTTGKTNYLDK